MVGAVLFDLDDTLYEYAPCNEAALEAVHARHGIELWSSTEAFRSAHDRARTELARELSGQAASHDRLLFFKRMIQSVPGVLARGDTEHALAMYTTYWERFLEAMRPAPHAHELLQRLCETHSLALVSNHTTHAQLRKVMRLGLAPYFRVIVTSEEAGAEKPAAAPFLLALRALGTEPQDALMIGDDPSSDIAGARALGLHTIHSSEFRPAEHPGSDAQIRSLGELLGHPLLAATSG